MKKKGGFELLKQGTCLLIVYFDEHIIRQPLHKK